LYLKKKEIKIERDLLRTTLTDIYIEMFQKIDNIFENININRWRDPLIEIFQFSEKFTLKLNHSNIIINGKILS